MNTWRILQGDVRDRLADLEAGSVRCCVTSPPYWGLRDYGVSGQLGLEVTPEAYVAAMVGVFADVRRVLADDGTLWLNLGDSYAASGRGGNPPESEHQKQRTNRGSVLPAGFHESARQSGVVGRAWSGPPAGYKQKDLVGIPWMVAFALRADGWYLRSDIIWSKPNPMPESVTDRPTKAHEYIFLLSKSRSYYYDAAAIAEASLWPEGPNAPDTIKSPYGQGFTRKAEAKVLPEAKRGQCYNNTGNLGMDARWSKERRAEMLTRNKRSVWAVATQPYPEAHFATFPEALIEPCILAGSAHGDTVLDPFTGSGTTGAVAIRHQRNFVGVELNPSYVELARTRIGSVAPMFATEGAA